VDIVGIIRWLAVKLLGNLILKGAFKRCVVVKDSISSICMECGHLLPPSIDFRFRMGLFEVVSRSSDIFRLVLVEQIESGKKWSHSIQIEKDSVACFACLNAKLSFIGVL
jgi:hypothetical protein